MSSIEERLAEIEQRVERIVGVSASLVEQQERARILTQDLVISQDRLLRAMIAMDSSQVKIQKILADQREQTDELIVKTGLHGTVLAKLWHKLHK